LSHPFLIKGAPAYGWQGFKHSKYILGSNYCKTFTVKPAALKNYQPLCNCPEKIDKFFQLL